jgi:hypothetical protein
MSGVVRKDLSQLCRTYNGKRYPAYSNWSTPEEIAEYKRAGVRCRTWRDVLYVNENDIDRCEALDVYRARHPASNARQDEGV